MPNPLTFFINARFNSSQVPTSESNSSILAKKQTIKNKSEEFDAAHVSLSESASQKLGKRAKQDAVRTLSSAQSYVDITQNAVSKIQNLVNKAYSIAKTLEGKLDPSIRDSLAEEGANLISEINNISQNTKFNDETIFDSGSRSFLVDLGQVDLTSEDVHSIFVENIEATSEKLGLTNLSSNSFNSDPTTTASVLNTAQSQLLTIQQNLTSSEKQVSSIAETLGIKVQSATEKNHNNQLQPEALASSITSALESSLNTIKQNLLDPSNVANLLSN